MGTVESYNCKSCGGVLNITGSICVCDFCGSSNIICSDTIKYINPLNRANKLRQECEFDRAFKLYDDILAQNSPAADILWNQTLCDYGVEYVKDPASGKYIPTMHRIKDESILNCKMYMEALELADPDQKKCIREEAEIIASIQSEYLDIAKIEKPYDVFICYKETDDVTGKQTEDSGMALDLYERLVNYGYKVFFSRVTLKDKLGINFEPYIFAALKSARVMVVLGTKPEYFTSTWVRNEWSRFLKLKESNNDKQLFFACDDPDDLPRAFSKRQSQILTEVNAIQNLAYNIKNYLTQLDSASDPHGASRQNETVSGETVRKNSLEEFERMFAYFNKKQAEYDEYDAAIQRIDALKDARISIFSIILTVIGLGFLVVWLWAFISIFDFRMPEGGGILGFIISIICFLLPAIITLAIGLPRLIYTIRKVVLRNRELPGLLIRADELEDELTKYFEEYGYCAIGIELSNPRIVRAIYDNIRQGMADSPKEAVNCLLSRARVSDRELEASREYDTFYPSRYFV